MLDVRMTVNCKLEKLWNDGIMISFNTNSEVAWRNWAKP